MSRPIIGITVDNLHNDSSSGTYEVGIAYSQLVASHGALPLLLPHEPQLARSYVQLCDGLILTGGVDPRTEPFGAPTHPKARPMDRRRQEFELALLAHVQLRAEKCVLGVCLGMQLMALYRGGQLDQYLPDTLVSPEIHSDYVHHPINIVAPDSPLWAAVVPDANTAQHSIACTVVSNHQQAVSDAGQLRVVATAHDNVIEAIDDPTRSFYLGVQWHPERGGPSAINEGLFKTLVSVAGGAIRQT